MRVLCSAVLFFEAIVVGLAIPVALTLTSADPALVGWLFGGIAVACLLTPAVLGRPGGLVLGSTLQVLVFATGFLVTAMFFLGGLFGLLWLVAIAVGRRAEAVRAQDR